MSVRAWSCSTGPEARCPVQTRRRPRYRCPFTSLYPGKRLSASAAWFGTRSSGCPVRARQPDRPSRCLSGRVSRSSAYEKNSRSRCVLCALMFVPQEAGVQMIKLGEVLVLTPSDGKPAGDAREHLLQADRGNRKGQFYRAWTGPAKGAAPTVTDRSTSISS